MQVELCYTNSFEQAVTVTAMQSIVKSLWLPCPGDSRDVTISWQQDWADLVRSGDWVIGRFCEVGWPGLIWSLEWVFKGPGCGPHLSLGFQFTWGQTLLCNRFKQIPKLEHTHFHNVKLILTTLPLMNNPYRTARNSGIPELWPLEWDLLIRVFPMLTKYFWSVCSWLEKIHFECQVTDPRVFLLHFYITLSKIKYWKGNYKWWRRSMGWSVPRLCVGRPGPRLGAPSWHLPGPRAGKMEKMKPSVAKGRLLSVEGCTASRIGGSCLYLCSHRDRG